MGLIALSIPGIAHLQGSFNGFDLPGVFLFWIFMVCLGSTGLECSSSRPFAHAKVCSPILTIAAIMS